MNKQNRYPILKAILVALMVTILIGCVSMGGMIKDPEIKLSSMTIDSLDLEGITFRVGYSLSNPYPIAISVKEIGTDVIYEESVVTEIVTDQGIKLEAMGTSDNALLFTLSYDTIFELAGQGQDQQSLPFQIDGQVSFDLSDIPYMENKTFSIPFNQDFEVPLFKPEFKVSGGTVSFPSVDQIGKALITSGVNVIKAAIAAGKMALGNPVDDDAFDGVDLDVTILLDVAVGSKGGAAWAFDLENCSIDSNGDSLLNMDILSDSNRIESSNNETIQLAAVVNTMEWGGFIIDLMKGDNTNSTLVVESGLTFPDLAYPMTLPLNIEKELNLDSFDFTSK